MDTQKTPLTDAEAASPYYLAKGDYVSTDFARSLERTAAAHAERVKQLEGALQRIAAYDVPDAHEMIQIAKRALSAPPSDNTEKK